MHTKHTHSITHASVSHTQQELLLPRKTMINFKKPTYNLGEVMMGKSAAAYLLFGRRRTENCPPGTAGFREGPPEREEEARQWETDSLPPLPPQCHGPHAAGGEDH